MTGRLAILAAVLFLFPSARADDGAAPSQAGTVRPIFFGVDQGRFEIIADDAEAGRALFDLAEAAWQVWREPLSLPARLTTGITVRLAAADGPLPPHSVAAETTGLVSLRLFHGPTADPVELNRVWLRGLAEAAWIRSAHLAGVPAARPPRWLVESATEHALSRSQPALMDAWQARLRAAGGDPSLRDLLFWSAGEADPGRSASALALGQWLRAESGTSGAWPRFTLALLRGESPGAALARDYRHLVTTPSDAREWEMLWQVVVARAVHARIAPVEEAALSRARIEAMALIIAHDITLGRDVALAAGGDWTTRGEAWLAEERGRRTWALAADLGRTHPFYHNAVVSLGRAWDALDRGSRAEWVAALSDWERDWEQGRRLERAVARLLANGGLPEDAPPLAPAPSAP